MCFAYPFFPTTGYTNTCHACVYTNQGVPLIPTFNNLLALSVLSQNSRTALVFSHFFLCISCRISQTIFKAVVDQKVNIILT